MGKYHSTRIYVAENSWLVLDTMAPSVFTHKERMAKFGNPSSYGHVVLFFATDFSSHPGHS